MISVAGFVRRVPPEHFLRLIDKLGIELPEETEVEQNNGREPDQTLALKHLIGRVKKIPAPKCDQLETTVGRLKSMTDEVGQAALLALPEWREQLQSLTGAHNRVLWLYLECSEALQRAEDIRFAEENQNAQRLWDAFVGPEMTVPRTGDEADAAFRAQLVQILDAPDIAVDSFERTRTREGTVDLTVLQYTIYNEGPPNDELQMVDRQPVHVPRRPIAETTLIYEPTTGTIEVAGSGRERRERIAMAFAETKLGEKIGGQRMPRRRFNLLPLLNPGTLSFDPADGIARVKLTRLVLGRPDGRLKETFEVPFDGDATLHSVLAEEYGPANPLKRSRQPLLARIDVAFRPEPGRKRGKRVNLMLGHPDKSNIRGKTEKERLILDKYLAEWRLRAAAA